MSKMINSSDNAVTTEKSLHTAWIGGAIKPICFDELRLSVNYQSWLGKSGQRDKWSFCLIAAMMTANRRDNEQTTAPEPHTGIQVEGGSGRHQGR